jgi:hypothetical protein
MPKNISEDEDAQYRHEPETRGRTMTDPKEINS